VLTAFGFGNTIELKEFFQRVKVRIMNGAVQLTFMEFWNVMVEIDLASVLCTGN